MPDVARRIKLRHLRILRAVVQAGSMGRAAEVLAVSQPVVSKAIAELEEAVGRRLLDRTARGVAATPYGEAMLTCSDAVLDELRQGLRALELLSDPQGGDVEVGCTEAASIGFVPAVLDALMRRQPRISARVVVADAVSLIDRELRERRIDVAIGALPAHGGAADVATETLFEDRHVVVAAAGSPWLRRRRVRLAALASERWILPPADSDSGRHVADAFRAEGLDPPRAAVVAFSMPLYQRLLASGRFLAVLPVTMVRLSVGVRLGVVDARFPPLRRSVAAMTMRSRTLAPAAALLIETAREIGRGWVDGARSASVQGTSRRRR